MVNIADIRTNQEPNRLDSKIIKRSMELIFSGWNVKQVPPLKGYFYTDHVEMTDGHHRYAAALALGLKQVPVINEAAMRRSDKTSYAAAIKKYRKLIDHPLSK